MSTHIDPGDRPPPPATVQVCYPRPGQTMRGVILSPRLTCCMTHWVDGRTAPHLTDETVCEGCRRHQVPFWLGFAPLLCSDGVVRIAIVSRSAGWGCPDLFPPAKGSLRGSTLCLRKPLERPNAPVRATVEPPPAGLRLESLPPPPDVRGQLLIVWRLAEGAPVAWMGDDHAADEYADA